MDPALTLAYRPFLDPLSLGPWWWAFLLPLALLISVAYKAVRMHELEAVEGPWLGAFARSVLVMTIQIILGIVALWIGSYLFVIKLLPVIAPMPGA